MVDANNRWIKKSVWKGRRGKGTGTGQKRRGKKWRAGGEGTLGADFHPLAMAMLAVEGGSGGLHEKMRNTQGQMNAAAATMYRYHIASSGGLHRV